jgi:hypothetical protein
MNTKLIHVFHDYFELLYDHHPLFRYVYAPKTESIESPKPYFHPLRTLAGNEVTLFRPHDHVWHKGLAMTMAHLSDQNFWGGPTYVRGQGYVQLQNNGRIVHRAWSNVQYGEDGVSLDERLDWVSFEGQTWLSEERRIDVHELNPARGYWALNLAFSLRNTSDHVLQFGSPTTEGRPQAGYGGLFWRGPRSFLRGTILAADGLEGPEVMGKAAPWLAFIGRHDGNGERSTIIFVDHPDNPRFPNKWFVRNDPYACVSCSFMFDEEYLLRPDQELSLRYRVVLADGEWSRAQIEDYARSTLRG